MSLPKIDLPLFDVTIPSTGKKTKFVPFTVKEEKILLVAKESKDIEQIVLAIKQIINNCVQDIDIDKLAIFDLEYLLLKLRANSIGNEIEFYITDPDTEERIELTIDINEVYIKRDENHSNKIFINENNAIIMRYPTIDEIPGIIQRENEPEQMLNIMQNCIESVVSGDSVFQLKDFSEDEITEFLEQLDSKTIKKIAAFFDTMPKVRHEIEYQNSNNETKKFVVEGTETFFI